jgi:hypothetical protein
MIGGKFMTDVLYVTAIRRLYMTMNMFEDWLIDRSIIYGFMSRSRIFHLYGEVTIACEGLQNLGLCSALRAFELGGSLLCHTCCDTGPQLFRSLLTFVRHTRGCGGSILTRILKGPHRSMFEDNHYIYVTQHTIVQHAKRSILLSWQQFNLMAYIFGVTPLRPEVGGVVKLEVLSST